MRPSDVREQREYLDLSSKSPGSHVQLSEEFELTEHSLNGLRNGRVDMGLAPPNRQDMSDLGPTADLYRAGKVVC